ncbi:hypothetical protein AQ490_08945 [Wenjunlia vitaminophila]|uniref:Calcineurin-like phosphoesterase domain-containing protein n=1 Tax=Wenjunlia vitaminophila TaxID=76728 RepID=A0A0T6LLW1_WENVI|nr:metallophosphoesterase [Wenjunlia vitaminophila]KRV46897.1 hypothetical protein AQ490_08945 [Wenjunlia vitaminophila]
MLAIAVLLVAALLLVAGVHYYLWRRLVRDTTAPGSRGRLVGTVAVPVLAVIAVAALVAGRTLPIAVARVFAWPGYLWLAVVLYLLLGLLVGELIRPVWLRVLRRRGEPAGRPAAHDARLTVGSPSPAVTLAGAGTPGAAGPTETTAPVNGEGPAADPAATGPSSAVAPADTTSPGAAAPPDGPGPRETSRRLFVARGVALVAGATAVGTVGYGMHTALGPPRLKRVTVPLGKLDPRAHGFRIAVVSDIHLGPISGRAHTQRIVDTINRTEPDLVAIVGDLVDGSVEQLGSAAEPLAGLRSRHGSFFVTGNHEYFSGAEEWVAQVRTLGVHPLENERVEIAGFDLAGVNDVAGEDEGQGPDFDRALGDRDPSRASVLLAHQPVQVHEAVRHGVDLQLSGHTHGGQMWPVNLVADLANPTLAGLERHGNTQLYVTRGAGFWGPPVRVGAPPDITVVTLASPDA